MDLQDLKVKLTGKVDFYPKDCFEKDHLRAHEIGVMRDIEPHLYEIEKQLLKASLSWPKEHLDKLVGADSHFWVPHQKSDEAGLLTNSEIEKWVERLFLRLI